MAVFRRQDHTHIQGKTPSEVLIGAPLPCPRNSAFFLQNRLEIRPKPLIFERLYILNIKVRISN